MIRSHIFTKSASADLREITRHTIEHWGEAQARAYAQQIEAVAGALATGQGVFKDLSAVLPGLRVKRAGHHYVFCVLRSGGPALILAILHERMDIMARLKSRLEP